MAFRFSVRALAVVVAAIAVSAPAQAATVSNFGSTGDGPERLALDGSGNVFATNFFSLDISKLPVGGGPADLP